MLLVPLPFKKVSLHLGFDGPITTVYLICGRFYAMTDRGASQLCLVFCLAGNVRFVCAQAVFFFACCVGQLGCVGRRYVTCFVALIGRRSIQLRPEAFWSASVDKRKSKMN